MQHINQHICLILKRTETIPISAGNWTNRAFYSSRPTLFKQIHLVLDKIYSIGFLLNRHIYQPCNPHKERHQTNLSLLIHPSIFDWDSWQDCGQDDKQKGKRLKKLETKSIMMADKMKLAWSVLCPLRINNGEQNKSTSFSTQLMSCLPSSVHD